MFATLKKSLLFFCCLISHSILFAFNPIYEIQKVTLKNGLSSDFIYDVVQDHHDLIWIATESGLNRYDGKNIRSFFHQKMNTGTLSNNLVQSLYADNEQKQLWVGTNEGLDRYNFETEDFTRFHYSNENGHLCFGDIVRILPDGKDHLWICSYSGGLFRFDRRDGTFDYVQSEYQKARHRKGLEAISMFVDEDFVWIGSNDEGVICYDKKKKVFNNYDVEGQTAGYRFQIRDFYEDEHGSVWLATSQGIYCKKKNDNRFCKHKMLKVLSDNSLFFIRDIKKDEVWVGTEEGIVRLRKDTFRPDSFNPKYETIEMKNGGLGLSFRSVRNIREDRYKNIWISTYAGGVNYIPYSLPNFRSITVEADNTKMYESNKILYIEEDCSGNIYLGTDGHGIHKLDASHRYVKHISFDKTDSRLRLGIIQSILCDGDSVLWVGTYDGGLIRYNQKVGEYTFLNTFNSKLPSNDVREIVSYDNEIIVGGRKGIAVLDRTGRIKRCYSVSQPGLPANDVRRIIVLPNGDMWMTLYNAGLSFYNRSSDRFSFYSTNIQDSESLQDNMIEDICIGENGRLWIVSRNSGLFYKDSDREGFKPVCLGNSQGYIRLFEDTNGILWLCTSSHIVKHNYLDGQTDNYSNEAILNTGMYFASAALKSRNGNIYFGGAHGVVYFSPYKMRISSRPALRPVLTDFTLYNQSVGFSSEEYPGLLDKSLLTADKIELEYDHSVFGLHFVSPNYGFSDELKYAFRLSGEEEDWNYVGTRTFAEYRNISPGEYEFQVKVANQDGVWNVEPTTIPIIIHPPFWKTTWMYCLYVLLLILLLYGVLRLWTYRLRVYNQLRYTRLERDKTQEVYQSKLRFFTNISHEFRTPITLISNPTERLLALENDSEKRYLLSVMKRNSDRLLRLVNQLLDLRRIDNDGFKLCVCKLNMQSLLHEVYMSFKELAERHDIQFLLEYVPEDKDFYIDRQVLEKCLYNLLSNAFKFTPSGGQISIKAYVAEFEGRLFMVIDVKDSGMGISKEAVDSIFDRFFQEDNPEVRNNMGSGIGLHLVKELMELHHGEVRVESEPNKGSVFTLLFPTDKHVFHDADFYDETSYVFQDAETRERDTEILLGNVELLDTESKKMILVVDDEPDIREFLMYNLQKQYRVICAENGEQALNIIRENDIHLILSDVMMPLVDGVELCARLKSDMATCHIPVILLTAKNALPAQIQGLDAGADDYISKPFHLEYLMIKIASKLHQLELLQLKYTTKLQKEEREIDNCEEKSLPAIPSLNDIFISKAIDFIIRDLDNAEFNGELLAEKLNMSRVHLHRKLKMITNTTTSEFIRNVRLNEAATLLRQKKMNVSEVSYATGFNSPAYFSSCFAKYFGISPKEYMAK